MAENFEERINELKELINEKITELSSAIKKITEELPSSIGQILMQFSDLIGENFEGVTEKFEDLSLTINEIKQGVTEMKMEKELELAQDAELSELIKQTVIEETKAPKEVTTPPEEPKPAAKVEKPAPVLEKPTPKIKEKPPVVKKPPIVKPAKPTSATEPTEEVPEEVLLLFEEISNAVVSNVTANELANAMNTARENIIKVFKWHPVLYELASFSRRIQKMPEGPLDAEITSLLLEKIEDWKNRISGE
ncbi:MAG: hypothetical protein HWN67_11180 [Candidatus Helarchaeota archaeon]|nr:hypothetical protein [Candidatus Helarchaeota archaeon]